MDKIEETLNRIGEITRKFSNEHSSNEARKLAEALCKLLILHTEEGSNKLNSINNKTLANLINFLKYQELKISENHLKRIKDELNVIRTIGNIESHDNEEKSINSDQDRLIFSVNNVIKLVFDKKNIFLDYEIPQEIYQTLHSHKIADENWRGDKIVSIVYPNRKYRLYAGTGYNIYEIDEADGRVIAIIFLSRNISFKKTFDSAFNQIKISNLSSLTFIFPKEISSTTGNDVRFRKENIERISKEYVEENSNLSCTYEFIEDYIWERCLPNSAKEINEPPDEPNFIDQKLYSEKHSLMSLEFIDALLEEKCIEKKPIYIIFGDGGAGKTTFCDQAIQRINKFQSSGHKKKALLISSFDISENILTKSFTVDSIQSLHSLIANEESRINEQNLGLNISSGNVLVIIDGLDEILSKLKEKFNISKFLDSVRELNDTYQNCTILITSRKISREQFISEDIHIFDVQGFDNELINKYIYKRFKNADNGIKVRAKEYIRDVCSDSQVTPLILRFACDLATDESRNLYEPKSKYFIFDQPLDKVIYQLINRDIGKQNLGLETCDQYFEILKDIVFEYNGYVKEINLKDIVDIAIAGTGVENKETYKNFLTSTLLSKKNTDRYSIKYDSLEFWIKSRFIIYIINNKIEVKDNSVIREISDNCYNGGTLVEEICKFKTTGFDFEKKHIKIFSLKIDTIKGDITISRKIISALLYIAFCNKNHHHDKQSDTEKLIELHENEREINNLSIYGDFYPIDFSSITVRNGLFDGYTEFERCSLPECKTVFFSCTFNNCRDFTLKNKMITEQSFDSGCCFCPEIKELLSFNKEKNQQIDSHARLDLKKILGVGFRNGSFSWKSEKVYKQQCGTLKSKKRLQDILDFLVKDGIIEEKPATGGTGIGYNVTKGISLEIKEFLTQSLEGSKIASTITELTKTMY